jgi:hypothetical protein
VMRGRRERRIRGGCRRGANADERRKARALLQRVTHFGVKCYLYCSIASALEL